MRIEKCEGFADTGIEVNCMECDRIIRKNERYVVFSGMHDYEFCAGCLGKAQRKMEAARARDRLKKELHQMHARAAAAKKSTDRVVRKKKPSDKKTEETPDFGTAIGSYIG